MNSKNDLTQGVIWKKLILYFLPIVAGSLLQLLYNTADSIIVGRFIGTAALAAVGGTPNTLSYLVIHSFVSLCGGASVVIAQTYGAREYDKVSQSVHASVTFCFLAGLVITALMLVLGPQILTLMKTPAESMQESVVYLRIYFLGCTAMILFNMGSGILRAVGNSRRPFVYLVISSVANVLLDLLFVVVFRLGVAGAAWATVLAQIFACGCVLYDLMRTREIYRLEFSRLGFYPDMLRRMLKIGVPSGIQQMMYGFANSAMQIAMNTLGAAAVAGWSISNKIDGVYWSTITAYGITITNFVAQNYGAQKTERIRKGTRTGFLIFFIGTLVLSAGLLTIGIRIIPAFTTDAEVVSSCRSFMLYFVPFYFLWTILETLSGMLKGIGDAVRPAFLLAITVCVYRSAWALIAMNHHPTLFILAIAYPISWILADISLGIYYKRYAHLDRAAD